MTTSHNTIARFQSEYEASLLPDYPSFSSSSKQSIGYFCTYTPIELIFACGYRPIRIMGGRGKTDQCYNYLPEFICPFMKRAFERAIDGSYQKLSGIIQSYTCDAVCGCQGVWQNNFSNIPVHSVALPYNDNEDSRNFYISEFQNLIKNMGKNYDEGLETALQEALNLYRQIRENIQMIFSLCASGRLDLSSMQRWYMVQAGFVMEPGQYLACLDKLLEEANERAVADDPRIPVLVSGSEVGHPDILSAIESNNMKIVWEDHCTGIRGADPVDGCGKDPLERLADRYMRRFPCASRSRAEDRWARWERNLNGQNIRGAIFILQKFCTPHLSDIPHMRTQLQKKKIPSLVLEMDESWEVSGQIQTRLEGFMEILGQR